MALTPAVLDITVRSSMTPEVIRAVIESATHNSPAGRFVRLRVGTTPPPLWINHHMRTDLFWQIDGHEEKTITAWERTITESEATN